METLSELFEQYAKQQENPISISDLMTGKVDRQAWEQLDPTIERLKTQAWAKWRDGQSIIPTDIKATLVGLGASVASPILRTVGAGETADTAHRLAAGFEAAAQENDQKGYVPGFIKRGLRGAGKTLPTAMLAGRAAGPYGAIGLGALQEADAAITDAKDAGLKGGQVAAYAGAQGLIEGAVATIFQKVGLGGLESSVGSRTLIRQGWKEALKTAGKQTLQELPEELITEIGHNVASKLSTVDPNALSKESLAQTVLDTTTQTIITMGLVESPNVAQGALTDRARGQAMKAVPEARAGAAEARAKMAQTFADPDFATTWAEANPVNADAVAGVEKPSRSQWREMTGFRVDGNPEQRAAFAENVRMALARRQPAGREGEPINDQGYRLNRDVRATAEAKAAQQQAPPPIPVEGATVPQFPTTQLSNEWTQIDTSQPLPQSGVEVYRDRHGQTFVRAAGSTPQSAPMDANSGAQSRQATLEAMSIGELNQEASRYGIKKGPKKSKMIERIMAAEAQVAPQISSPPPKPSVNQQIPKSPEGAALPAQPVGNVPTAGATTTPAPAQINAEAPVTPQIASVEQPAQPLPPDLARLGDDELGGWVKEFGGEKVPRNPPKTYRARLDKAANRILDAIPPLRDALSGQPQQQRPAARRSQQPDVPPAPSPSMETPDAVQQKEEGRQEGLLTPAAQENPATPAPREERTSVRSVGADEKAAAHSDLSRAFPGSSITELPATREHMGGYRVELPNGRFFDVLFLPQSALTDRTSIIKSLRGQLGRDPTEQEISDASAMGAFFVETKDGRKMPGLGAVALAVGNFDNTTIKHEGIHLARRIGLFTEAEWQALENKYAKGVRDRLTREGKTPQEIEDGVEEAIAYSTKAWDNSEPTLTEKIKAFFSTMLRAMGINPDARLVEVLMRSPEFWSRNPTTQPDVQFTSDVRSNAPTAQTPPAAINPTPVNEVQTKAMTMRSSSQSPQTSDGYIRGRTTSITAGGKKYEATYAITELENITPSHDFTRGSPRDNTLEGKYPANLQPRDYTDANEKMKVRERSSAEESHYFLEDTQRADGGPPTVSANGIVFNGNGRAMMLQMAAGEGRYGWYKSALIEKAQAFGIDPSTVEGMNHPVLVRVVDIDPTAKQAQTFAAEGNTVATMAQSPLRTAASLSKLIDADLLDSVPVSEEQSFSDIVANGATGRDFREMIFRALPASETPRYFNSDHSLNSDGKELVRNMLLTRVLPVQAVEKLVATRKQLSNTIASSLPTILRMNKMQDNKLGPQFVQAVEWLNEHSDVSSQRDLDDALNQRSLLEEEPLRPSTKMFIEFMVEKGGSVNKFKKNLSQLISDLRSGGSGSLFGGGGSGGPGAIMSDALGVTPRGEALQVRSRANIGETGPVRRFTQEQDPTYNPQQRSDEEVTQEASSRLRENGYDVERKRLMKVAEEGGQLNDVDTVVARRVFNAEAQEALKSGDSNAILGAQKVLEAYRRTGTEQGRAFRQRRDWQETPVDERRRTLAEAVLTPPTKTKEAIDNAMKEGNGAEAERLRRKWADEYKVLKKQLMLLGVDLDNLNAYGYDPVKAARALGTVRAAKADMWDKAYEYWRNAILSGTGTQVTNALGTAIHGGWKFLVERPLESVVNLAMRRPEGAQIGEFRHVAAGILPGLQRAARNAMTAWNTELPELERQLSKEAEWRIEEPNVAIKGNLGRWVRGGFIVIGGQRGMLAADDFMKSFFATLDVGAQAYRAAKAQGLTGDKMREFVAREVNDLKSTSWAKAHDTSLEVAFQQKGTKASRAAKRALLDLRRDVEVLGIKPLAFIFPFVTTPVNILETGLRKSPVTGDFAAMKRMWDNWRAGRSILTDMTPRLAERIVAWGTVLALSSLVGGDGDEPFITGTVDSKDRGQRDLSRRTFHPQSINIGGRWYSYSRVEPFATALALTVDWVNAGAKAKQTGDYTSIATTPFTSLFAQMKDKTFLDGVGDVMRIIEAPDPVEEMANWSSNFAVSWVPNIVRSTLRATSDTFPERGVWGEGSDKALRLGKRMLQRTELGIVKDQPAIDLWGREAKRGTSPIPHTDFLWRIMSPSESRIPELFIGDRAILNWNAKHPGEELLPSMPQRSIKVDGKQVALTDEQLTDYLKLSGTIAKGMVERLNIDPENPTEQTIDEIKSAIETARSRARDTLKMEWKGGPRMAPEAIITAEFNRDVNAKADVLTRLPPKRLLERRKWLAERAEALDWLKAKGVSKDAVIASYVPELKSIKTPKTRFQKRARLLRSLSSL